MFDIVELDAPLAGGNPYFGGSDVPRNFPLHAGGAVAARTVDVGDSFGDGLEDDFRRPRLSDDAARGSHALAPSGWGLPPTAPGYDWRTGGLTFERPAPFLGGVETSREDAADVFNAESTAIRRSRRGVGNPTSRKPETEVWPGDFDAPVPLTPDLARWKYTSAGGGTRVASRGDDVPSSTRRYTRIGDTWVPTRDPASDDFSFAATARIAIARGGRA